MPGYLGDGYSKTITLFSGAVLYISNLNLFGDYRYEMDEKQPDIGFGFCLSGQNLVKNVLKYDFSINENQSSFYRLSGEKGEYQILPGNRFISVGIMMKTEVFCDFMEEEQHCQSTALRRIIEKNSLEAFRYVDTVTPAMKQIIKQLLLCPNHEPARRFFFEAKSMELVFHKLNQLDTAGVHTEHCLTGNLNNADKIYMAEALLKNKMDNPPGLAELSRSVGLSRTQLLRDFQKIFHTSPYSHLRNIRLRKAKTILFEGQTNITETAYMIGYSSASHFTKAFKQYFGMTPSCYIRSLRA